MTSRVIESLLQENRLLRDQVNQLRYFLVGSHGLQVHIPDVETGQTLYCDRDDIHRIASGLLAPSVTCADIGPGLRPQRMLHCPVHVLVEPWAPYADRLLATYPEKLVVRSWATPYLSSLPDRSIDTIFMLDVIEHIEKAEGERLLFDACRVARKQVVVFTPLGFMPHEAHDTPPEWAGVEHGSTQKHLSGWLPSEMPPAIHVVCEDYHVSAGTRYGAFYSIIPRLPPTRPRLLIVSEPLATDFRAEANDVLAIDVCFAELSHVINTVPKHNAFVVPLQLMAEQPGLPLDILRRTLFNLPVLMHHVQQFERVEAHGLAARTVLHRLRSEENIQP